MQEVTEHFVSLSRYDYLVVFIGILMGLSVGKIVSFVGALVSARKVSRVTLIHGLYLALMFVLQVHYWWSLWHGRSIGEAQFFIFLYLLILPLLMYVATSILCPEWAISEEHNFEEYLAGHARLFYLIIAGILLVGAIQGAFYWHQPLSATIIRGVALALILPALFISNKTYHTTVALVLFILFIVYIFITNSNIGHPIPLPIKEVPFSTS
jgi:hypothetical protein